MNTQYLGEEKQKRMLWTMMWKYILHTHWISIRTNRLEFQMDDAISCKAAIHKKVIVP
jgi:hypothetical protein